MKTAVPASWVGLPASFAQARGERRLLNLQKKLARLKLLIVDELGFVLLSKTAGELVDQVEDITRGSARVPNH